MNTEQWVSSADLHYKGIDRIPDAGMPIGNGRMGTLVWFTERELHMQINRVDLFAMDSTSNSFPVSDTDFSSSCGLIDIDFGEDVFGPDTEQHLSVYDGVLTVTAGRLRIQVVAVMNRDAILLEIDDQRRGARRFEVCLRAMREGCPYIPGKRMYQLDHPALHPERKDTYSVHGEHISRSTLRRQARRLELTQDFDEGGYHAHSVMEINCLEHDCETWFRNDSEARMTIVPDGRINLCVSTGLGEIDYRGEEYGQQRVACREWWHAYWQRAPKLRVYGDPDAELVGAYMAYFLYIMACTSRGSYMPRYGGLLFYTGGDFRLWGAQYWWHNQQTYYLALANLGADELTKAMFEHIWSNRAVYADCARDQWGTEGIFIPETCWFSGPGRLPEDIAAEMCELYTNRKPWSEASARFKAYAAGKNVFESRWNWQCGPNRLLPTAPYCYVNHIFSTTAKVAYIFWLRYRTSGDIEWLRNRAYPMLRDCAEMYRHLPFLETDADGSIHIRRVNNHENLWDSDDTISELGAMHGVLPLAIRASEILDVDDGLRQSWQELLAHLTPIRTNKEPGALPYTPYIRSILGDDIPEAWHSGMNHAQLGMGDFYHNHDPLNMYEIVASSDERAVTLARTTYELSRKVHLAEGLLPRALDPFTMAIGKENDGAFLKQYIPKLLREIGANHGCEPQAAANANVLDNRLDLREGPNCPAAQRIGEATLSVQFALCQLVPEVNGGEQVLHLFEGLPEGWNAEIELPAGGGWRVLAQKENGVVKYVRLVGGQTGKLRMIHPVNGQDQTIELGCGEVLDIDL